VEVVALKTPFKQWLDTITVVAGIPHFQHPKDENIQYDYIPWFEISKGEELNKVQKKAINKIRTQEIFVNTVDQLTIFCENKGISRESTVPYESKISEEVGFMLVNIFPVLNNLRGPSYFMYYVTEEKGVLRLWIHNGDMDWMVRCSGQNKPEPIPEQDGDDKDE